MLKNIQHNKQLPHSYLPPSKSSSVRGELFRQRQLQIKFDNVLNIACNLNQVISHSPKSQSSLSQIGTPDEELISY